MPNLAPVVDLNGAAAGDGASLSYTEGDALTAIAPDATATDADWGHPHRRLHRRRHDGRPAAGRQRRLRRRRGRPLLPGDAGRLRHRRHRRLDAAPHPVQRRHDPGDRRCADPSDRLRQFLSHAGGGQPHGRLHAHRRRRRHQHRPDGDGRGHRGRHAAGRRGRRHRDERECGRDRKPVRRQRQRQRQRPRRPLPDDLGSERLDRQRRDRHHPRLRSQADRQRQRHLQLRSQRQVQPPDRHELGGGEHLGRRRHLHLHPGRRRHGDGDGDGVRSRRPGRPAGGDENDNVITGSSGDETFLLQQGGTDTASGLGGNDVFYFGGALQADDNVSGGSGDDTILLQGDYSGGLVLQNNVTGIESISMLAGSNIAFGAPGTDLNSYAITTHDSNFAAGVRAKINGSVLLAGENLTFDGSAETDASFLIYGGRGTDQLTGGTGNDIFFFASDRFAAGDTLVGGQGYDALFLYGAYTIDFGSLDYAGAVTGLESIGLSSVTDERYARGGSGHAYDLTLGDGLVGAGGTLTVNGAMLQSYETMEVDGSGETDGLLRLFGGAAADILIAGAGADLIYGGGGADSITGGLGADTIRYDLASDSSASATDSITGFLSGTDKFDLTRVDADSNSAGNQAFTWIGSSAFSNVAGQLRAFQSGSDWIVQGDTDGNGVADLVINVTAPAAPLVQADFLL